MGEFMLDELIEDVFEELSSCGAMILVTQAIKKMMRSVLQLPSSFNSAKVKDPNPKISSLVEELEKAFLKLFVLHSYHILFQQELLHNTKCLQPMKEMGEDAKSKTDDKMVDEEGSSSVAAAEKLLVPQ